MFKQRVLLLEKLSPIGSQDLEPFLLSESQCFRREILRVGEPSCTITGRLATVVRGVCVTGGAGP